MLAISEPADVAEPEVVKASILAARIVDPKFLNGKIVGGQIIGGRIVDAREFGARALYALDVEAEHRRTEIVAIIGLGLAFLLMYLL